MDQNLLRILAPILIAQLALAALAVVDLIRREPERVRGSKLLWGAVSLLFGFLGPIAYFTFGRKD